MTTEQATPRNIVLIVVVTLAVLCVLYMTTLSICILRGLTPDEKVLLQFVAGGTYVLGVLSGMLINPRGPQTPPPGTETREVSVTASTVHEEPKPTTTTQTTP